MLFLGNIKKRTITPQNTEEKMTEFLVKHFIKNYEDIEKVSVRTAYGVLASVVGILCNILLFFVKGILGIMMHSVSVLADAFNNLSDAGSSIISFIGVKVAQKPADQDHPFGHGRAEYVSALIVSFLVIQVGFTFFKDAIGKIKSPEELNFHLISVGILLLSVGVKLWLGLFNQKLGKKIDSKVMLAVFTDSMGDVITTAATIFSILFYAVTDINIDGIVGAGVSLVVMWAGVEIARDTLEPLIGSGIDPELYRKIKEMVESYDGIIGTHDLIVHNYGPNRSMASIHAEVPNNADIEYSHEIIDRIERDAQEKLGVFLVAHMDPVETKNTEILKVKSQVHITLLSIDKTCSIHDFRMIEGKSQINLVFDMVVPVSYTEPQREQVKNELIRKLKEIDPRYECVITTEHSFVSDKRE